MMHVIQLTNYSINHILDGKNKQLTLSSLAIFFGLQYSNISCGPKDISIIGPGQLKSPGYPNNYPSSANCKWIMTSPSGTQIKIVIENLEIEQASDCAYDRLQISDLNIGSLTVNHTTRFCGVYKDRTVITKGNIAQIQFVSDINYEEKGFRLKFSILSEDVDTACNMTLKALSGTVTSPAYPENYPNNVDCWIKISVQPDLMISLTFKFLMLEHTQGHGCKYDFLKIYDGNQHSRPVHVLCEKPPATAVVSTGNEIILHFHSDEFLNSRGYVAEYHALTDSTQVRTTAAGECEWYIGKENGTIASPNFPKKYPNNARCVITLAAPTNYKINLKFEEVNMEAITDSPLYDYVQVYDGPSINSSLLGTYAGTTVPDKVISSTGRSMTVLFVSDDFVAASGFKASYHFSIKSKMHETTTAAVIQPSEEPDKSKTESVINDLLSEIPNNAAVTIGNSYVMKCTPRLRTTTITWMKEQNMITSSNTLGLRILDDDSLSIDKMDEHLEGTYTCVALGANGKTAVVRALLFSQEPKLTAGNCQISFINKPKNKTLLVGEFTFLGCFINDASMSWKKNGNPIIRDGRLTILPNGHLTINNVQETDTGVYTCTASHRQTGCVRTASSYVQVIKPANVNRVCGKPILSNPENEKPRLKHGKIVNGFAAHKGAHPWMAMLYTSKLGVFCGGSLINEQWIVTAAHCFSEHQIPWSQMTIKLGKIDKSIREDSEQAFEIEEIITNSQFDPSTYNNDIALIKLKTHATFTNSILPICLGTASFQQSKFFNRGPQMGIATGWGSKWYKGPSARVLLEVVLPIKERSTCRISTRHLFTSNMFCAGFAEAGAGDTCKGDSGGPFVMSNNGQWYLVGITSWGEKCSEQDKYGYYTTVSNYVTWIHSIIKL